MKILNRKAEMTAATIAWQGEGETVCLVPTMGSIHQGHLALIAAARKTASRVIVSIYVNPTQFGAGEDFDHYPRTLDADCAAITSAGGCDAIYAPAYMYDDGHATSIVPAGVALAMEGQTRPHFFTGVATIVLKLFTHIPANFAIFWRKRLPTASGNPANGSRSRSKHHNSGTTNNSRNRWFGIIITQSLSKRRRPQIGTIALCRNAGNRQPDQQRHPR
jgi:hypothetical protein